VVPPPVSWWPPAPGRYVVGALAIALAVWSARHGWERRRATAYRRAVLPLLLRWALPPYRRARVGVTVPFLDRVAVLTGQQPATGVVVLRPPLVQQIAASETGRFARLERACLDCDAPAAYKALFAWLERLHPRARPATIEQDLPAARTDAELRTLVEGLEAAVVAGQKR